MYLAKTITASILLATSAAASATVFEYNNAGGTFGDNNSNYEYGYDSLYSSYDTDTGDFEWTVDYADDNAPDNAVGDSADAATGGWLVVSAGENPKGVDDELAILYFDATSGDVWAYAYNGVNSSNSYQTTAFLGYFAGAYTTVDSVATLALNAAGINTELTAGIGFGSSIGIWFHPAFGATDIEISDDEGLSFFSTSRTVWYDSKNETTTQVPAPATLALLGLGLLGFGLKRRHA